MSQLGIRSDIVLAKVPGVHTVVGIATDRPGTSSIGYSSELLYMTRPTNSNEDRARADEAIRTFGFFESTQWPLPGHLDAMWSHRSRLVHDPEAEEAALRARRERQADRARKNKRKQAKKAKRANR